MSKAPIPKAVWEGKIEMPGCTLEVFVLDSGERVVSEPSLVAFLEWLERPIECGKEEMNRSMESVAAFVRGKGIPAHLNPSTTKPDTAQGE